MLKLVTSQYCYVLVRLTVTAYATVCPMTLAMIDFVFVIEFVSLLLYA